MNLYYIREWAGNGDLMCGWAGHRYWSNMAALPETDCPCTNDKKYFRSTYARDDALIRGEFELPTAGDVEWLQFSYT